MKKLLSIILFFIALPLSFAAKDPLHWQLNEPFPDPVFTVGGSYSVTYTFTNQIPFQLVQPLKILKEASPASEFSYVDHCSGIYLLPLQSCSVEVFLDPLVVGEKFLALSIANYDNNIVPLPDLTTFAKAETQVIIEGSVLEPLPYSMKVDQTGDYTFLFTNTGNKPATGVSIHSNNPSYKTSCTSTLAPQDSCTVSGTYVPHTTLPQVQNVDATFNYTQGEPVKETTHTNVAKVSGVIGSLVPPNFLPPVMLGGVANTKTLAFLFTNYTQSPVTILTREITISGSHGASFTINDDSCSGQPSLKPNASCQILGSFVAPTATLPRPYTVTAKVTFSGGNASIATGTTVVSSISPTRIIQFVNQCNFKVWFSLNGSALSNSPSCTSDADCPPGSACNPGSNLCYWYNHAPANGNYLLNALGGTNSVTIPATTIDPTIQWSGNFSASTLCNGSSSCGQADCQNKGGSKSCMPGVGFSQPATQAEITMLLSNADSYDVEVINGFHLPIKMEPGPFVNVNNYTCGTPGNENATNGFGACNWSTAIIPDTPYFWVTQGGETCGKDLPACSAGNVCGLDNALNRVCGAFLGYWSANQACSVDAQKAQPYFGCNNYLSTPFPANTFNYKQLMACAVPKDDTDPQFNSCYLNYAGYSSAEVAQCCGCIDWWKEGIAANPDTQSCTLPGQATPQTDPQWLAHIKPTIAWMKKACPSAYTYSFDDATSDFSCSNNLPGSPNSVNYTVTFCPGENTGLPADVNEGRKATG